MMALTWRQNPLREEMRPGLNGDADGSQTGEAGRHGALRLPLPSVGRAFAIPELSLAPASRRVPLPLVALCFPDRNLGFAPLIPCRGLS